MMQNLEDIVGKDHLRTDSETCANHAVDGVKPRAVLFPGEVEEVEAIVRLAFQENLAVVPWGGGTLMEKGNIPSRLDLVISMARLNRVIDVDAGNLTVTVQAGVRLFDLQESLAGEENRCYIPVDDRGEESHESVCSLRESRGCFVPLDVPAGKTATIGGILAANGSGPRRLLYGLPRDVVLGIRHVTPTGDIVGTGGKTVKNVAGYDLCKLLIGSMGTLGIISEVTLRLLPLPERSGTWFFVFPGSEEASACVDRVFALPLIPCAMEILNRRGFKNLHVKVSEKTQGNGFAVAAAFEGQEEPVERMKAELETLADEVGAVEKTYLDDNDHRVFWSSYGSPVEGSAENKKSTVILKLNYPISHYREVLDWVVSEGNRTRVSLASYTHAGNGVTRIHLQVKDDSGEGRAWVAGWTERLLGHISGLGGNLVVEHASPGMKKHLVVWGAPREDRKVVQRLRKAWDPKGIFSPGRFMEEG